VEPYIFGIPQMVERDSFDRAEASASSVHEDCMAVRREWARWYFGDKPDMEEVLRWNGLNNDEKFQEGILRLRRGAQYEPTEDALKMYKFKTVLGGNTESACENTMLELQMSDIYQRYAESCYDPSMARINIGTSSADTDWMQTLIKDAIFQTLTKEVGSNNEIFLREVHFRCMKVLKPTQFTSLGDCDTVIGMLTSKTHANEIGAIDDAVTHETGAMTAQGDSTLLKYKLLLKHCSHASVSLKLQLVTSKISYFVNSKERQIETMIEWIDSTLAKVESVQQTLPDVTSAQYVASLPLEECRKECRKLLEQDQIIIDGSNSEFDYLRDLIEVEKKEIDRVTEDIKTARLTHDKGLSYDILSDMTLLVCKPQCLEVRKFLENAKQNLCQQQINDKRLSREQYLTVCKPGEEDKEIEEEEVGEQDDEEDDDVEEEDEDEEDCDEDAF
jgi:hypothetical protein